MKLEHIKTVITLENGRISRSFTIGSYEVEAIMLPETWDIHRIYVDTDERNLPRISYNTSKQEFQIQTASYGSLNMEDMQEMMDRYHEAMIVVKTLTKYFINSADE